MEQAQAHEDGCLKERPTSFEYTSYELEASMFQAPSHIPRVPLLLETAREQQEYYPR